MIDENKDQHGDEKTRGMPSINQRGPGKGGIGQKIITGVIAIFVVLALVAVNGGFSSSDDNKDAQTTSNDKIGNRLGPAPELPPPPPPPAEPVLQEESEVIKTAQIAPPPPPRYETRDRRDDAPSTPEDRKIASTLLAFGNASRSGGDGQAMTAEERAYQEAMAKTQGQGSMFGGPMEAERADGLGAKLTPTKLDGTRANIIADINMFITKGTFLDCALETAISSDVPGMTSCRITRDVYSTSGKVLLLERGSRIVGQYQSGVQRGQARIFVLWNRVETPTGVVVTLDSPGTDALGRSGHSGYIDTHFWERFSGAIMLSLIDDVGTWIANESSSNSGGNNQVQFGSTTGAAQNSAGIALENSINIPPTLVKHQGDHINVFVARDLDFRGVYELKAN